jgi:general secretion pathway protein G
MKRENEIVGIAKRGFTLVELLVVVAIIGLLASAAVIALPKAFEGANETTAQQQVKVFAQGVTTYQMQKRRLPKSLEELVEGEDPVIEGGEGVLIDPWGEKYQLKTNGKKRFYVVSAGSDGQFDTDDDVRSDRVKHPGKEDKN